VGVHRSKGIYDSKIKGAGQDQPDLPLLSSLRETIPERSGFRDRYNWYVFTIANPDKAPEVARKIDGPVRRTRPTRPRPATEKQFVSDWAKQIGDIGKIMMGIVAMAMFTILLVAGNTMAQADPRANQRAGGAQDLGLRRRPHSSAWSARIGADRHAAGGPSGWSLSYAFITFSGDPTGGLLRRVLTSQRRPSYTGMALVLVLGLAAGFLPRLAGEPASHRRCAPEK
jgi:putative ABC transport system permease protein